MLLLLKMLKTNNIVININNTYKNKQRNKTLNERYATTTTNQNVKLERFK